MAVTDLLLYLGLGRRCGHSYRIRSRFLLAPTRSPSAPFESESTHVPSHFSNFRAVSGSSWFDFFGYRGEPAAYTQPDCRSEATVPEDTLLSHPLIVLTVEAETLLLLEPRVVVGWPDCCASDSGGLDGPESE